MKLTPWLPANVKPIRVGVYAARTKVPWYRYWDGTNWCVGSSTPELAQEQPHLPIEETPPESWRGLAEEPK